MSSQIVKPKFQQKDYIFVCTAQGTTSTEQLIVYGVYSLNRLKSTEKLLLYFALRRILKVSKVIHSPSSSVSFCCLFCLRLSVGLFLFVCSVYFRSFHLNETLETLHFVMYPFFMCARTSMGVFIIFVVSLRLHRICFEWVRASKIRFTKSNKFLFFKFIKIFALHRSDPMRNGYIHLSLVFFFRSPKRRLRRSFSLRDSQTETLDEHIWLLYETKTSFCKSKKKVINKNSSMKTKKIQNTKRSNAE